MKYFWSIATIAIVALSLVSCKTQFEALMNSNDLDAKYNAAFEYFNNKKYNRAAQLFESVSVQTSGTERDDTVQFYWAFSNYKFKDYVTAEANFARFIEHFPRSPFSEDARFMRLECLYRSTYRYELDQTPTIHAMEIINEYMTEYPESEHYPACKDMMDDLQTRLDTKSFEAARLYYHMEDYLASRVAFRNVLKENSENKFREEILYYTAMSSYKYAKLSVYKKQRERYLVFIDDYLNFVGEYSESKYRKELDVMYKRAQKALGRDVVDDANMDMKDKQFIKERKKIDKEAKKVEKAAKKLTESETK